MRTRHALSNPHKPPIPLPGRIGVWETSEEGFPRLPGLGRGLGLGKSLSEALARGRLEIGGAAGEVVSKKNRCSKEDNLSESTRCSSSEGGDSREQNGIEQLGPKFTQSGVKVRRKLTLKERQRQKKNRVIKSFEGGKTAGQNASKSTVGCFVLNTRSVKPFHPSGTPGGTSGCKREKDKRRTRKEHNGNPFDKCLNLASKGRAQGTKGTKPVHPKKQGSNTGKFAFANSGEDLVYFTQSQKYKTEMCKNFELKGKCKWGENCCFAHGKSELRKKTLFNYFYKTKICKHFHRNGYCPYASRCQYFHFKTFQKFQELLESFSNKLYVRLKESPEETLGDVLGKTAKM